MIKQSIAISFVLLLAITLVFTTTLLESVNCSTVAATAPFILKNNLFQLLKEKNPSLTINKRFGADNICCLPQIFSMKGQFTQIFPTSNSTLTSVEGGVEATADYLNGKIYQKVTYNTPTVNSIELWELRMSSSLTISYTVQNGRCTCFQVAPQDLWKPPCIPPFQKDEMIRKVKIGNYDGLKISGEQHGMKGQFLTFREPQMSGDKCWILSNMYVSQDASQEQLYYDMIEKVDSNNFRVPSHCPTVDKCL